MSKIVIALIICVVILVPTFFIVDSMRMDTGSKLTRNSNWTYVLNNITPYSYYVEPVNADVFRLNIDLMEPGSYHIVLKTLDPSSTVIIRDSYIVGDIYDKFGNKVGENRGSHNINYRGFSVMGGSDKFTNFDTTVTYPEGSRSIMVTASETNIFYKGKFHVEITQIA